MSIPTLHWMLRASARASGAVFLVAFAAPGIAAIWHSPFSRALQAAENRLLLLFVFLHTIHLGLIFRLGFTVGPQFLSRPATLVPGAMVFLLIYGLTVGLLNEDRRVLLLPLILSVRLPST